MVARNLSRHYCRRSGIKRKNPDSSPALTSGRGTTGTAMQICEEIGIQQNFFDSAFSEARMNPYFTHLTLFQLLFYAAHEVLSSYLETGYNVHKQLNII